MDQKRSLSYAKVCLNDQNFTNHWNVKYMDFWEVKKKKNEKRYKSWLWEII